MTDQQRVWFLWGGLVAISALTVPAVVSVTLLNLSFVPVILLSAASSVIIAIKLLRRYRWFSWQTVAVVLCLLCGQFMVLQGIAVLTIWSIRGFAP
jgi:hypothetical protein